MKLILNVADCTGIKSNCIYPHEVVVTNPQEMAAAITHDHVIAKYKNNYRSIENFIEAHGYFFDNDNDFSDDPSQWITEDDLEEIFSDLEQTIKEMEDGEISLEESFRLYHQGMDMLKACNSKIDKVEKKMLLLDEEGEEHEF